MKAGKVLAAGVALVGMLLSAGAQADQLDDIKKKGEVVIGVLGTDEPNSFVDPKTRELVGYEVDLARAVAKKLGVKPVFKQIAVAARIPELQQGHVDLLAASLTHNKEREAQVAFGLTHFITGSKVLVRNSSGIKELAKLSGKKVVTVKGGTQETNIRAAVPGVDVVTFETTQQAFQALQQGKGIAYVNDESSLLADFSKLGAAQKDYTILDKSIGIEPLAFGLRKGEDRLKALADGVLRELEASGEAEKIFLKWYGPNTRTNFSKRNFKIETDKL